MLRRKTVYTSSISFGSSPRLKDPRRIYCKRYNKLLFLCLTGANDLKRAQLFTKLGRYDYAKQSCSVPKLCSKTHIMHSPPIHSRDITTAVKMGGSSVETNARLRTAIENARKSDMPKAKIDGKGETWGRISCNILSIVPFLPKCLHSTWLQRQSLKAWV